jgi:hypothetical protein
MTSDAPGFFRKPFLSPNPIPSRPQFNVVLHLLALSRGALLQAEVSRARSPFASVDILLRIICSSLSDGCHPPSIASDKCFNVSVQPLP